MPCEEQIRIPVAQYRRRIHFRAEGVGVKIFEKFASESERNHEIDSIVKDLRTAHSAQASGPARRPF